MRVIKKFLKNNIFCFILGAFIFGVIGVSAATYFASSDVTYDNSESGLLSTDVQGAIDELYDVCSIPSISSVDLLDKIVTTGSGLYKDTYETGKYVFKGEYSNNYVLFNDELWRIISIEDNGTMKIMRNESIESQVWDSSGDDDWTRPASLNTYLNGAYYNHLSSNAKEMIVSHDFGVGKSSNGDSLTNRINNENSNTWYGKIGLITVSEYIRANSNQSSCSNVSQVNDNFGVDCRKSNWMYSEFDWWTISAEFDSSYRVAYYIDSYGRINDNIYVDSSNFNTEVRPVLYLSSNVKLRGNGTVSEPYEISL